MYKESQEYDEIINIYNSRKETPLYVGNNV